MSRTWCVLLLTFLATLPTACGAEAWERDPQVQAAKAACKRLGEGQDYDCIERHAVETLNPDICRLAGIWIDDMCLQAVYEAAGDPSICDRLYLEGVRPTCRAYYAARSATPTSPSSPKAEATTTNATSARIPLEAPSPIVTVRPSASPARQPEIVSKGILDCVPVGAFSRCVDEVLNIAFEHPSSWGEIEAVLRTGGYAGYAYDYHFGGKAHAEIEPLVAGGRSVDFSEGRGAMPTDFGGYEHPGWQGTRACDSRWNNWYPLCRQVSDNVAWMIRFPNASALCEDVLGNWQTMPVFRIEINLPDNPTINGFVFEAPFFSEQFAGRVQNDLYPLLGARLDRRASQCDEASRQAFDVQLMSLIESITDRSADAETLQNVDELVHLAESITVREITAAPLPTWRHILFVYNHDGATELWTIDPASGEAQRQIRPEQIVQDPALSPSGKTIAYVHVTGDYGGVASELWLMDRDGANPRSLYVPPSGQSVLSLPAWSPDGQAVYFRRLGGGADDQLLRIPVIGGEPTVILTDCLDFALSPDGQWLASMNLDRQLGIFWPDGSWFRDIEPQGAAFTDYYSLAASPDSRLVAFRATEAAAPGEDTWNLYVMNWDGHGVHRLTDLKGFHPFSLASGQVNGLAWTADGAHLVYSVDGHPEQSGIWLIDLDGRERKRLFAWQEGEWAAVQGPWFEQTGASLSLSGEHAQALLDDLSQALSSGHITHEKFYSPAIRALIAERRAYYREFHQMALHSSLLGISSRYKLDSVVPDAVEDGLYHVRAMEMVTTTGRYQEPTPEECTSTRAALWALARTDHPAVQQALQEYITREMARYTARINTVSSYDIVWIVRHHLLIRTDKSGFAIVQDTFDDKASDRPEGYDVVGWADGRFVRHKPDWTVFPDYAMYHEPLEKVESLGRSLLQDKTRMVGGTPAPDPYPGWLAYTHATYGFSFRYPPDWTVISQPDVPNLVWLRRGDPAVLELTIGFRWPAEAAPIQRTGVGAGEIETQGTVYFLGRELSRQVLTYEGKVKAVLYNNACEIDVDGLIFTLSLDSRNSDYNAAQIEPEMQAIVDEIVESFLLSSN